MKNMCSMCSMVAMLALWGQACAESDNNYFDNAVPELKDGSGVARSLLHSDDVWRTRIDKYKSETDEVEHRAKRVQDDARTANRDFKFARRFVRRGGYGRKLLERSGAELRAEAAKWKKTKEKATRDLDSDLDERTEARKDRHIAQSELRAYSSDLRAEAAKWKKASKKATGKLWELRTPSPSAPVVVAAVVATPVSGICAGGIFDEACATCLTALTDESSECPAIRDIQNCNDAAYGDLCEGDGECGTDNSLDNCGSFEIYRKTAT